MSENTNSLFWIITGAVVVIAIYVLVDSNIGDTVTNIFNHFNGLFNS